MAASKGCPTSTQTRGAGLQTCYVAIHWRHSSGPGVRRRTDLRYFTKEICHIDYVHAPALAPTADILDPYKKHKNGDWALYERQFLDLMARRHIEETVPREVLDGGCLLCSEEKPHHCHRRMVAEYLQEKWGDVQIEHMP